MNTSPMRLFAGIFFVSMIIWIVLTVVLVLTTSQGAAKADAIFAILWFGSLLLMIGTRILERSSGGAPWAPKDPPAATHGPSPQVPRPPV